MIEKIIKKIILICCALFFIGDIDLILFSSIDGRNDLLMWMHLNNVFTLIHAVFIVCLGILIHRKL